MKDPQFPIIVTIHMKDGEQYTGEVTGDESSHPDYFIITVGASEQWISAREVRTAFYTPRNLLN